MSKYGNKKVEEDGYEFDSMAERDYYRQLKWLRQHKEIAAFTLQPRYTLLEAFEKDGKKHRKTEYIADFEILHNDNTVEVVDVKGMTTPVFQLKRKLFESKYPHKLSIIAYSKIDGGFIELDQLHKNRKKRRKEKVK